MSKLESVGSILKRVVPCFFEPKQNSELRLHVLKTYRKYPDLSFEDFTLLYPAKVEDVKKAYDSLMHKGWL